MDDSFKLRLKKNSMAVQDEDKWVPAVTVDN